MLPQVLVTDPKELDKIREREFDITKERIEKILGAGANVILTTKGIDDMSLKYFVEAGAIACRRVPKEDLRYSVNSMSLLCHPVFYNITPLLLLFSVLLLMLCLPPCFLSDHSIFAVVLFVLIDFMFLLMVCNRCNSHFRTVIDITFCFLIDVMIIDAMVMWFCAIATGGWQSLLVQQS